jgi:hypothetical protein
MDQEDELTQLRAVSVAARALLAETAKTLKENAKEAGVKPADLEEMARREMPGYYTAMDELQATLAPTSAKTHDAIQHKAEAEGLPSWLRLYGVASVTEPEKKEKLMRVGCCAHEVCEPHTCPYVEEIYGDESLCTCCERCESECAADI